MTSNMIRNDILIVVVSSHDWEKITCKRISEFGERVKSEV